jgi:hypothetical protein
MFDQEFLCFISIDILDKIILGAILYNVVHLVAFLVCTHLIPKALIQL